MTPAVLRWKLLTLCAASFLGLQSETFATPDCGVGRLKMLRDLAQSLSAETPAVAERLLSCPDLRDEAMIWLSFFLKSTARYEELSEIQSRLKLESPASSHRARLLADAVAGKYLPLEKAVATQTDSLGKDAEAILILARALMRAGREKDARLRYDEYLTLKPDDDDIKVEAAYSWLWEGKREEAQRHFKTLLSQPLSSSAKSSAASGLELASRRADTDKSVRVSAYADHYRTSDPFTRRGYGVGWRDERLAVSGHSHTLFAKEFGLEREGRLTELVIERVFKRGAVSYGGKVGVASAYKNVGAYDLILKWVSPQNIEVAAGATAVPLAKFVPLPDRESSVLDQFFHASVAHQDYAKYRYERHSVADFHPFDRHSAEVYYLLHPFDGGAGHLKFRMTGRLSQFPRPNPLFYSPHREAIYMGGLIFKKALTKNLALVTESDLGIIETRQISSSRTADSYEISQLRAQLTMQAAKHLLFDLTGFASDSRRDQVSSGYKAKYVQLMVTVVLDGRGTTP